MCWNENISKQIRHNTRELTGRRNIRERILQWTVCFIAGYKNTQIHCTNDSSEL